MRKRLAVLTAGLLATLMAIGTANALVLDTTPGSESTASEQATAGMETTYEVGDAGTVTLTNDGSLLEVVSVQQNDGWLIEIEVASGREVEVDFRKDTRRIQFNAELEDGEIRVRARERIITATSTTQATTESSTSPTAAAAVTTASTGTVTYEAGAAGTVTIANDGSQLTIAGVDAADGWSHEIEVKMGREVEMDFRKGGDRVQFNAELEDGDVRVRVRTRTADGARTEVTNGVDTTDDDHNSGDDSMDDRNDDESRDNSGRGHADDNDDDSRDNSGPGNDNDNDNDDDHSSDD